MSEPRYAPLLELTTARMKEFLREPEAIFWVFAFPVLMALALGVAFRSQKPQEVVVGVIAADHATGTDGLAQQLQSAGGIRVRTLTPDESDFALRNGLVSVVVTPGSPPTYRYDPTRPESHVARLTVDNALQRAAGRHDVWTPRDEQVVTPGSRYIDWLLPGLLGMNIMGTGLWSVGFSIVIARMRKLLKRLIATPMSKSMYLLAQAISRLGFLVLEVVTLLGFGYLVFGVKIQGSIGAVAFLCLLGTFSFTGLGLLLASRAKTIEGVSGLMNLTMLPMWLLSGVFFASSNFPDVAQPFIQILPLTALNNALRAVMIEARPLASLGREIATLALWGVATFGLALKLFRWR